MKTVVINTKNIKKMRIDYYIIYSLIALPFIFPYYFGKIDSFYTFGYVITYVSMALMAILYFKQYFIVDSTIIFLMVWYLLLIYSTRANLGETASVYNHVIKVVLLCLTVGIVVKDDSKQDCFLAALTNLVLFFFIINLVLTAIYPNGIPSITINPSTPYYLYGNVNSTIKYTFAGMCCSSILDARRKKISVQTFIFFGGMFYIFVTVYRMGTAFVALAFVIVWLLLRKKIQNNMRKVYFMFCIFVLVTELLLTIVSSTGLLTFIAQLFGKDADFSGRTLLWNNILLEIIQKPLWGHGIQSAEVLRRQIGNSYGCHNYYLDIVYQTGIIGIFIFIILVALPILKMKKRQKISDELYVMIGYWGAYMLMFLAEPFYDWEYMFIPLLYGIVVSVKKINHKS